jgi:hypothetical protein
MRNLLWFSLAMLCLCTTPITIVGQTTRPDSTGLQVVAQLPPELPQRIKGFAYDGEKFWATIYLGRGSYATLDPATLTWKSNNDDLHSSVIRNVAGAFASPGGVCFAKDKLWIAGAYGQSFGSIDRSTWKVEQIFKGKQREDKASQSYSSIACDGNYLWIAWHWFRYDLPVSETQLLLKVDPSAGTILGQYPVPGGSRADGTHGLTWDGTRLWHMKDSRLSSIDPSTGAVTAQYMVEGVKRPSGLAWANNALWIAEFEGAIWRLPFR